MKVRILGCSGSAIPVGDADCQTTAYQIGQQTLIDAGSGVLNLSVPEIFGLKSIFISHSHLDHVLSLPLLADTRTLHQMGRRDPVEPLTLYGLPETIDAIGSHLFNDVIFPDFRVIPSRDNPAIRLRTVEAGVPIDCDGFRLTPYRVNHVVPTVGYLAESGGGSIFFSGDTTTTAALQQVASNHSDLTHMIVEMTFPDSMEKLAVDSGHFSPRLLAEAIGSLDFSAAKALPKLWTTHAKPEVIAELATELAGHAAANPAFRRFDPELLSKGQILTFNG